MTTFAHAVNEVINNCTIIAQPTGSGIYGDMYQLQRADGTQFYAHLPIQVDDDTVSQLGIVVDGFEINSSHPLPISLASSSSVVQVRHSGGTSTVTAVTCSSSSTQLGAANANRRKWIATNDAAVMAYVKIGATASTSSYTYALAGKSSSSPGGSCEGDDTTVISAVLASSTGNVMFTEVTA